MSELMVHVANRRSRYIEERGCSDDLAFLLSVADGAESALVNCLTSTDDKLDFLLWALREDMRRQARDMFKNGTGTEQETATPPAGSATDGAGDADKPLK